MRARRSRQSLANGPADVAILEVSDTGKGIPPDVEKRLFDPFFTTKEKGTGLGLAIAARMVEMNGGTLQYQTRIDHGSTFVALDKKYPGLIKQGSQGGDVIFTIPLIDLKIVEDNAVDITP